MRPLSSGATDTLSEASLAARYRQARRDPALAVIEGFHAVKHAVRFGADLLCLHGEIDGAWQSLAWSHSPDIAERLHQRVRPLPRDDFRALAPQPPDTGLIALARRPPNALQPVWSAVGEAPLILLDHPAHGGNTGAVIRTAAAAGAAAVVCLGPNDPWHPSVIRGAAGLHFALTVAVASELPATARRLLAFDAGGEPLGAADLEGGPVVALGSERRGLGAAIRARADRRLALPMRQGVSSLNLAATAAAILYQWRLTRP